MLQDIDDAIKYAGKSESNMNYFSLHAIQALSPTTTLLITTVGEFGHNGLQVYYLICVLDL